MKWWHERVHKSHYGLNAHVTPSAVTWSYFFSHFFSNLSLGFTRMSISFLALWERLFTSHDEKKNVSLYPPTKYKSFPQNRYIAAYAATI